MRRTRSIRAAAVILAGVVVGWAGMVGAPAASGAEESRAFCVAQETVKSPVGLTSMPSRAQFTGVGHIDCSGDVRGHPVTGRGKWDESVVVEGSCATGEPNFEVTLRIPTEGGQQTVQLKGKARYIGATAFRPEGNYPGGFVFYPTQGDCVTSPVTQAEVVLYGVLLT